MQKLREVFVPRHKEAVILGMGPSRKDLTTRFAEDKSVALINRAGYEWPGPFDYWITYHAERIVRWWYKRVAMELPVPPEAVAIVSANKRHDLSLIPHFNVTEQIQGLNTGGTSSLLAAIFLLSSGYKPVHLFGVDLNGPARSKERKFWVILKDQPLVFHGEDWFHRKNFKEEKRRDED